MAAEARLKGVSPGANCDGGTVVITRVCDRPRGRGSAVLCHCSPEVVVPAPSSTNLSRYWLSRAAPSTPVMVRYSGTRPPPLPLPPPLPDLWDREEKAVS